MSHSRPKTRRKSDADFTLDLICGRWKVPILRELHCGPRRTGNLVRALEGVSKNRLNDALRGLLRSGIIRRRVYSGKVPRVEYEVSALGKTLCPIVNDLHEWGVRNRRRVESAMRRR